MRRHSLIYAILAIGLFVVAASARPQSSQADVQALLKQYCVTCHNQRAKTASLELDTKDESPRERCRGVGGRRPQTSDRNDASEKCAAAGAHDVGQRRR